MNHQKNNLPVSQMSKISKILERICIRSGEIMKKSKRKFEELIDPSQK